MAGQTRKPARRGATAQSRKRTPPRLGPLPGWLWGLGGLVIGFYLAQHQHGTAPWQTGPERASAEARQDDQPAQPEQAPDEPPSAPRFEFYTLLPETEVIAPGGWIESPEQAPVTTLPESVPEDDSPPSLSGDDPIAQLISRQMPGRGESADTRSEAVSPPEDASYMLQAASFQQPEDAERLRNRLRNLSLLANVSTVNANGATWHRVQVGPYQDRRELARAQDLMNTQGIEPMLIQLQQ